MSNYARSSALESWIFTGLCWPFNRFTELSEFNPTIKKLASFAACDKEKICPG